MRSGVLCFWCCFWGAWWLFVGGVFCFLACVGGFVLLGWWFLGLFFCLVDVVVLFVLFFGVWCGWGCYFFLCGWRVFICVGGRARVVSVFFGGGLFWLPCRVCWVVFVVCGVWVVFLVSLMCISLCVPLGCVAWVGWVGVFWGYGCGVLVFCFWRFLCLLVVVFCRVLVL